MTAVLFALSGVVLVAALAVAAIGLRAAARRRAAASGSRGQGPDQLARARTEAQAMVSTARAHALMMREAALDELAMRRAAVDALEGRLEERERELREREAALGLRVEEERAHDAAVEAERASVAEQRAEVERTLERAADIDRDTAERTILGRVEEELAADHPGRVARSVDGRVGDVVPAARSLLDDAIQRQDSSHADSAPRPAPIALEGLDEGDRERLLAALGVIAADTTTDLGVDSERNQATLRGLDPVGRELARQASLEVIDRKLQTLDVPPLLLKARRSLDSRIVALGERALWDMQMEGRPELAELLGVLHYRFSYGQNALLHCQETGYLCAVLAAELRMDEVSARQAGLLHDIGKAVDHDVEGSHAIIGGELLTVLGAEPGIVHAVKAHHFDEEPSTDLAMLTICADAISASRPGARRDTLTTYLQRLEQLQQIATRHSGVERAFPMQAGREVRVSVRPDQVSDGDVAQLCAAIAHEIEAEMTYPGMIKVTVIRETSATATAS